MEEKKKREIEKEKRKKKGKEMYKKHRYAEQNINVNNFDCI